MIGDLAPMILAGVPLMGAAVSLCPVVPPGSGENLVHHRQCRDLRGAPSLVSVSRPSGGRVAADLSASMGRLCVTARPADR